MTEYLTLVEAAKLVPGATVETLRRRVREGKLTVYRPARAFLTTRAEVERMVQHCRVEPNRRTCGNVPPRPPEKPCGSSSTDVSSAALDSALEQIGTR